MAITEWTMLYAIGGKMLEVREDYALGELPLTDMVKQPTGVYHAGAIVTLADEVASQAIHGRSVDDESMEGKKFPYSIQISVNLLTNDPVGPMRAEAKVIRKGGIAVVDTTVTTSSGATAALMRSTHRMVDLNKTGPHKRD
ncbi:MAG: PaaI family thioesterase [Candidatus Obscuribacterales bacterium]|nr:PaaI family thioesterase [Candidatus Obscuribacterales bacterium]